MLSAQESEFARVKKTVGGVMYKICNACERKRKWPDDYHRRAKGSDVRSNRCKFCAAAAQRKLRRTKAAAKGKTIQQARPRLTELEKLMRKAKISNL